jgi:hypothetical protein
MSDIFISYKREEQPIARMLADALEREAAEMRSIFRYRFDADLGLNIIGFRVARNMS